MSAPATKRARAEAQLVHADAATHHTATDGTEEDSGAAAALNDRVVVLNVGGAEVTTLQSTLCSSPSLLAEWAKDDFREFPRDLQGRPFLDRDPVIFSHIINYLRGYGLPSKADDLVVVAEDAELFQLESLKREIGLNPPAMWRFTPGPGVREDGVEFSTSDILDLCGTEPLSTGLVHTIVFRMDKCELVSVGVVAFKDIQLDMQIRRQKNSVCYCNTGEFVRYWSADALYDQGVLYKSQDEVTVRVEFAQPGVPLESSSAVAATADEEALMPALQPALRLTEPLPSSVTAVAGSAAARPVAPPSVRSTVTITTGIGAEPNATASALQPGSPAMDATTNTNATPLPPANRGAMATPAVVPPMGSPVITASPTINASATTAAPAPGQNAAAAPPSPSLPVAPLILDPEDPDVPIGAVVTFFKGDKEVCRARWPAPVPPLQFAVSMQGASAVSILKASSVSAEAAHVENEE